MAGKVTYPPLTSQALQSFESLKSQHSVIEGCLIYPAYYAMLGDTLLGCGGIVKLYDGVWSSWSYTTEESRSYPVATVKAFVTLFNKMLDEIKSKEKIRRLQAIVADDNSAVRLNEMLGYEIEGRMKSFYDYNKDAFMMGQVIHD